MASLEAVLSSTQIHYIHIDSDGVIGLISKGFCQLVEHTEKELTGSRFSKFVLEGTPYSYEPPIDWLAEKFNTGEVPTLTHLPIIKGSGDVIFLNFEFCLLEWPQQKRPEFGAFVTLDDATS